MIRDPDTGRAISPVDALRRNHIEVFHAKARVFFDAWRSADGTWHADILEERVKDNAPAESDCAPAGEATHLLNMSCTGSVCGASGPTDADINDCTCLVCLREHTAWQEAQELEGWYWWTCVPGCLPDSDPSGPFPTERKAARDALDGLE